VIGIEAREYLVDHANSLFHKHGVPENRFRFIADDVFRGLDRLEPNTIDTVLLLGFFYHQGDHMMLLSKIDRLRPKHVIIDTAINMDRLPTILLWDEKADGEANAAPNGSNVRGQSVVAGAPSKSALDLMLRHFGWNASYFDWSNAGVQRWDDSVDYHEGWRVTLRADCHRPTPNY
jgi:hypothetical protein